ncbi:Predicted signal transduction protein [Phaffia rhodozyma]|uniref:Predicted signal transduction protein n=1 Tax=Phaffia rhodozyma TaxID=264483 RepID=A0A0F7SEY5_PHARH|nr:Predicted signal transduction protein [Phaffia rhodozyma]
MNQHLSFPFKTTVPLAGPLANSLRTYITANFKEHSPEAFKQDISHFCLAREEAVEKGIQVHRESVSKLVRYHAHLNYLLGKLPADIGQPFPYTSAFPPPFTFHTPAPVELPSLAHERFAVLFNLGACYSNLGGQEGRLNADSLKRAIAAFQNAAGVFHYLLSLIPDTSASLDSFGSSVYDFKEGFIRTLLFLTQAMAQECFWQQAVLEKYKNGIVAKLAMKVSDLYEQAILASKADSPAASSFLPSNWTALMNVKQLHFQAVAHYRMGVEDLEKNRYGNEIARLEAAEGLVKKTLGQAKSGVVSDAVIGDIKGFLQMIQTSLVRARKDNDLIYLSLVPPAGELASIQGAMMVKPVLPVEVGDGLDWLINSDGGLGWEGLVDWGVHVAISIYDDRKDSFVKDEIIAKKLETDQLVALTLQSLNLPGSLQAIERPIGLPPSLLGIADDIKREKGADRVRGMMENVGTLRARADGSLNTALDILDQEAEEDESTRAKYAQTGGWSRPPSFEVNEYLITQAGVYRGTLTQAGDSDSIVRQKWEEWEEKIEILGGDEEYLTASIPRLPSGPSLTSTPAARSLHTLLETLSDLTATRTRIADSARSMAARDDVRSKVISEANSIQAGSKAGEVKAEWFEKLFEKELRKYEGLEREMVENSDQANRTLEELRTQNEEFIHSRKTSPIIKAREKALQSFDIAHQKYREVVQNLEEGIKFYSGFLDILSKFQDECQHFVWGRRSDVIAITAALENARLNPPPPQFEPEPEPELRQTSHPSPAVSRPRTQPATFSLPHPNSSDWTTETFAPPFPPPPPPHAPSSANLVGTPARRGPVAGLSKESGAEGSPSRRSTRVRNQQQQQ